MTLDKLELTTIIDTLRGTLKIPHNIYNNQKIIAPYFAYTIEQRMEIADKLSKLLSEIEHIKIVVSIEIDKK